MTDEIKPISVIYIGRTKTSDNKIGAKFLTIEQYREAKTLEEIEEVCSLFAAKERELPRSVGTVYKINGLIKGGRLFKANVGSCSFDPIENDKHIVRVDWTAVWEARSESFRVAARAEKLHAAIIKDEKLPKLLRSLRHQYGSTDRLGKLALEVVVLDILRRS